MPVRMLKGLAITAPPGADAEAVVGIADADALLDIVYVSQDPFAELCWAACCEMVFQSKNINDVTFCHITYFAFAANCPVTPTAAGCGDVCDSPCWPDATYRHWGFDPGFSDGGFSDNTFDINIIRNAIRAGNPVNVCFRWDTSNAHMISVVGCYANGEFSVLDPLTGSGRVNEDYLRFAGNKGKWESIYVPARVGQ